MPLALIWIASAAASHASPAVVLPFLRRREECAHWAGEEPYDRARAAQIAAALRRLRCTAIDGEEAALRRRHAGDPATLRLLDTVPGD